MDSDENDVSTPYLVVVKVNGETKVSATPFGSGTDNDYHVNYSTGQVIFHSSLGIDDVVTATYSYATDSVFVLRPASGKVLSLLETECQLSTDLILNDDLVYGVYVTTPGGEICVKEKRYKKISNFIDESTGSFPVIPAIGGPKRGCPEIMTLAWPLKARTDLKSSLGMSIKIRMANDVVASGSFSTITFYCISASE